MTLMDVNVFYRLEAHGQSVLNPVNEIQHDPKVNVVKLETYV